ncbi:MAG: hypothetical protein R3D67_13900 [Hyphomicrobiaceae bacterium]
MSLKVSAAVLTFVGAAFVATAASAAPVAPAQSAPAVQQQLPVETVQCYHKKHRYCFYLDGWHGPGWYRCGWHHRRGYGWGGPRGWNNWSYGPAPRKVYRAPVRRHYEAPRKRYIERH